MYCHSVTVNSNLINSLFRLLYANDNASVALLAKQGIFVNAVLSQNNTGWIIATRAEPNYQQVVSI